MKDSRTPRLLALAGFLAMVLLIYLGVLYDTQVNDHDEYLAKSLHSIAKVETIEASRGIITDRKGRPLVSNDSVYDLTFDSSLLKEGEDQNQAILRLLELCQEQDISWVDNLPISANMPYTYTLDTMSATNRSRFFSYVKSLKEARSLLGAYLLEHPGLVQSEEETDETAASEEAEDTVLSLEAQGDALVDALPLSAFTAQLLNNAGLTPTKFLSIMREQLDFPTTFSQTEARQILGVRYELALRRLTGYTDYVLVEDVDTGFISRVTDGQFAGAKITSSSVRQYETTYAAHILGTVGLISSQEEKDALGEDYGWDDWVGKSGVEAAFEEYLKGTDGRRVISTNSEGKITGEYYSVEPQPGSTVELTIDLELQEAVENALAETVTKMNAEDGLDSRGAGAVVIKVGTGEILSLASYPTYDLATFRQSEVYAAIAADPAQPMFNRATQGAYAPGSTLKPLTAVASLEEGVTTLTEKIRDTGRWAYPNDPTGSGAKCWIGYPGHGLQTVTQAITNSCNYFFAEMGYRMGMDAFTEYLSAFGLGSSTGIEIGDKAGKLPENQAGENQAPWAAFGQSNQLYTPIQLANYIATLVSGGKHCEAHLLKAVKAYDNSEILAVGNTEPVNTVDMRDSTLEAVKEGMLGYTQPGGMVYSYFKDCVVTAGAKTGTAQLGENKENNGVFVCFAPYDDPEIAVSIVIEKGGSGAALASAAVKILNACFSTDEIGTAIVSENQLLR